MRNLDKESEAIPSKSTTQSGRQSGSDLGGFETAFKKMDRMEVSGTTYVEVWFAVDTFSVWLNRKMYSYPGVFDRIRFGNKRFKMRTTIAWTRRLLFFSATPSPPSYSFDRTVYSTPHDLISIFPTHIFLVCVYPALCLVCLLLTLRVTLWSKINTGLNGQAVSSCLKTGTWLNTRLRLSLARKIGRWSGGWAGNVFLTPMIQVCIPVN